jgi:hypothetical protein
MALRQLLPNLLGDFLEGARRTDRPERRMLDGRAPAPTCPEPVETQRALKLPTFSDFMIHWFNHSLLADSRERSMIRAQLLRRFLADYVANMPASVFQIVCRAAFSSKETDASTKLKPLFKFSA